MTAASNQPLPPASRLLALLGTPRARKITLLLWGILAFAIAAMSLRYADEAYRELCEAKPELAGQGAWHYWTCQAGPQSHSVHTVVSEYYDAGYEWRQGLPLYKTTSIHGFLYFPTAAIAFAPFSWLPFPACEALWRLLIVALLGWALLRFSRLLEELSGGQGFFPLLSLLALPTAGSALRNGQMNMPLAALMLLAVEAAARRRWSWVALWIGLGVALKPQMIVLGLLLGALYFRPLAWRLALAALAVLAFPFCTQAPAYAAGQYRDCLEMLRHAGQPGAAFLASDFFGMLRVLGAAVPDPVATGIRAAAALLALGVSLQARRHLDDRRLAIVVYSLAATYLMLMNPRAENNGYFLLAAAIAGWTALALQARRPREAGLLAGLIVAILVHHELVRHVKRLYADPRLGEAAVEKATHLLCPLAACAFAVYLGWILYGQRSEGEIKD